MVSRKVLDERGVFTCDMDDLHEQLDEIYSTLTMLTTHTDTAQDPELQVALQGVARSIVALARDVNDIDDVLRERGAVVDAYEHLRRMREQEETWNFDRQEVQ